MPVIRAADDEDAYVEQSAMSNLPGPSTPKSVEVCLAGAPLQCELDQAETADKVLAAREVHTVEAVVGLQE